MLFLVGPLFISVGDFGTAGGTSRLELQNPALENQLLTPRPDKNGGQVGRMNYWVYSGY